MLTRMVKSKFEIHNNLNSVVSVRDWAREREAESEVSWSVLEVRSFQVLRL